jgi:sulfotransferase
MDNGIHFISGLPRSGSTLLAAVLRQNPRLHAHITSPMGNLLTATMRQLCQDNETSVFVDNEQRRAIFQGLFDGYYGRQHPIQTVFDTHRVWAAKIAALKDIFPDAKMICCVRHVPWIIDSLERLVQANPLEASRIINYDVGMNVYARYEAVSTGAGLVGYAWNSLRDAFYGPHNESLMLLTYETLVTEPRRALRAVYDFIGAPAFAHDFETISFATEEFDSRLGAPGLHRVRAQISHTARRSVLPPDLFARVEKDSFWREPEAARHGVLIV